MAENLRSAFARWVGDILFPSNVAIAASLVLMLFYLNSPFEINQVASFLATLSAYVLARKLMGDRVRSETRRYTYPSIAGFVVFSAFALILPMERVYIVAWVSSIVLNVVLHFLRDKWKISAHSMAIASVATVMSMASLAFLPTFFLVPVVAWSRFRLKKHTKEQIIAGITVGIIVPLVIGFVLMS